MVKGLMYVLSTGCQWRAIHKDLPPRSTVHSCFDLWTWAGRNHESLACEDGVPSVSNRFEFSFGLRRLAP
jgi:transposase